MSVVGSSSFEYQPRVKGCQEGVGVHCDQDMISWSLLCGVPGRYARLLKTKYKEMKIKLSGIVP